jgi:hypothetical protein
MASLSSVGLWRDAHTPVAAHELAAAGCNAQRYAHVRGVAQQAARLARATQLSRASRAQLLCAAWLHWLGSGATTGRTSQDGPRALRRAGQEHLARIVAWSGGARQLTEDRGFGALAAEFRVPTGDCAQALILLDIALVSTDAAGAAATPALVLRGLAGQVGQHDPAIAAFVGLVADLSEHPEARVLLESLAPQPSAVGA